MMWDDALPARQDLFDDSLSCEVCVCPALSHGNEHVLALCEHQAWFPPIYLGGFSLGLE